MLKFKEMENYLTGIHVFITNKYEITSKRKQESRYYSVLAGVKTALASAEQLAVCNPMCLFRT